MLLRDFFDRLYIPRRLRGKSDKTIRLYRLCLSQFDKTLCRSATIEDLTEDNVLIHLSRRSNVAPSTRNKELSQLVALWRFACQRGMLKDWPGIQPESEPERAPIAWMPDELNRLLETARRLPRRVGKIPARIYWPLLIRLTLDTGERAGAIRQAQWSWLQGGWLCVPAEARKGKTRDRRYRLSAETTALLKEMRKSSTDRENIFPWPYGYTYFWNRYRKILKAAGLPATRKHQLHCLRKTTASAVYAAGLDPQEAMDHADRRTTARYLDPRFSRERQSCDVLAEFISKREPAA